MVQACIEKDSPLQAIPGPCSLIQGPRDVRLRHQPIPIHRLPAQKRRAALRKPSAIQGQRLPSRALKGYLATLEAIEAMDGERLIAVAREMTKTFEECRRGTAAKPGAQFKAHRPRGEVVLLISAGKVVDDLSLEELVTIRCKISMASA